ncbi:MAG: YkgJ family cysteine cluster protein [Patescibacteria group bacterium]
MPPNAAKEIATLQQLYHTLDELYRGIEHDCAACKDPDCMGYIWLMKQEVEPMYEAGIPLVQLNKGPVFIHSFPQNEDGTLKLSARYPVCSQQCTTSRRCTIHENRPLVCRLYPIGLETTQEGMITWALHRDCLFARNIEKNNQLAVFTHKANAILEHLSPKLLGEILEMYREVDAITHYPFGENNYYPLKEICRV